jgi:class 3 adenylate cyclase
VGVGHPDYHDLDLGQRGTCDLAVAFIDMTGFTARSSWEPPDRVTDLAVAVLTQIALIVEESGGFVLGLRGDGVMAGWGGKTSDPQVDVAMCLAACAVALDAGQGALRELLILSGIEPVQLKVGADFGRVDFIRTGTDQQSEVNIVGHPANFAAKCEKYALSWDLVVGEGLAGYIPDRTLLTTHEKSPKQYQYRGQRRSYAFYDVAWSRLLTESLTALNQVSGWPTSLLSTVY